MFTRVLIHELKSITRDKMYAFLAIYPIVMAVVAYFLIPYLNSLGNPLASNIVTVLFILINGFMFGAVTGFTLLDDQDDKVILSLRITPIDVSFYVFIKLAVGYVMGILSTILLLVAADFLPNISFLSLVYILILAPMSGPIIALFINCFATNKVEGFVMMKLSGIILMVPIAALFLTNWTEIFLFVIPGFWPARIISMTIIPMDFFINSEHLYFILGLIVNLSLGYLIFRLYAKRVGIRSK
jgi:fluoroquinolone transport system permease protein